MVQALERGKVLRKPGVQSLDELGLLAQHNISTSNTATRTITLLRGKDWLNFRREIYTKAIYEFVNPEACIILTMALDVELVF